MKIKFLITNYSNYSKQIPNPKSQLGQLEIRSIRLIFPLICLLIYCFSTVSLTLATYNEEQTSSQAPFVPNQVIVKYKENQTPAVVQSQVDERSARAQSFGGIIQNTLQNANYRLSGQSTPEEKLKRIENANDQAGVVKEEELFTSDVLGAETPDSQTPSSLSGFYLYTTDGSTSIPGVIQMYQTLSEIEFAEPNYMMKILETPNDSYYSEMWNLGKIQMEAAWDQTKGDNSVKVAVVDTGINYNHEDFSGRNIINERDFSTCAACDANGNCIQTKSRDDDSMDDNGHGSHVAGTIGAVTNNNKGIAGINWNVSLMAVKALGATGCGGTADIVEAIKHAADKGAKVINLSLGGEPACSSSGSWQSAINYVRGKGTTIVVAAGNENQNATNFTPASCNGVIAIGATNSNDQRASFSNYGSVVDLAAPGVNILSTLLPGAILGSTCGDNDGDGYGTCNGTSMASPHVAGVAALLLAKKSSLTADQIEQNLRDNGDSISTDKPIGKRLNANKALLAVSGGTPTPTPTGPANTPTPTVTPGGPTATPTRTPTPTVTPGGPTNTPTPSVTPGGPTVTPTQIPSPTSGPSPTPIPTPVHPCREKAEGGDYNCNGVVDKNDYDAWLADYKEGKTILSYYEYWRRAFYGGGGTLSPTPRPSVKPTSTPTPAVLSPTPTSQTTVSIPFGIGGLPEDKICDYKISSFDRQNLYNDQKEFDPTLLQKAKSCGIKVILRLHGLTSHILNDNGVGLNLKKYEDRIKPFAGLIDPYVEDGTILAHFTIDEPHDCHDWGGTCPAPDEVDQTGAISKKYWPNLSTMVNTIADYASTYQWKYTDIINFQYAYHKGDLNEFVKEAVDTKEKSNVNNISWSIQAIAGGCPQFQQCPMSPEQVEEVGTTMCGTKKGTFIGFYRYDENLITSSMQLSIDKVRSYCEGSSSPR